MSSDYTLVAPNEEVAAEMRKAFPGWTVVLRQKIPEVSRGMIELKQNRSAKRTAAKRLKREDK